MRDILFSNIKNFRYERKFYIEGLTREEVETVLKCHPAIFKEIYHERTINNIYFDSLDLKNYFDNQNGVNKRLKIRIRWYGNTFGFIEKPRLEIKLKHNLHIGKLIYPLTPFSLDGNFSINTIHEILKKSSFYQEVCGLYLMELDFSLFNTYTRKYFLSSNRQYRATIDTNMQAYKLLSYKNNFMFKIKDPINTILEIKYNMLSDKTIDDITTFFPFRITRSSKYIDGIRKVHM